MGKMIERAKMSKKARRELDAKKRVLWETAPIPRIVESKKRYQRKPKSHARHDAWDFLYPSPAFLHAIATNSQFRVDAHSMTCYNIVR